MEPGFEVWWEKIHFLGKKFVSIVWLKQIFHGITQFGGAQKYLGAMPPMPLVATSLAAPRLL